MSLLDHGPPEVLSQIFSYCTSFTDVLSLASACKHLHSVWVTEHNGFIWDVGETSIIAFDHAVIAVRATAMVLEAHLQRVMPPIILLSDLSGLRKKPTLDELKKILDMEHLVLCIEHHLKFSSNSYVWGYTPNEFEIDDDKRQDRFKDYRHNIHRAVYRLIIAGAVLCRAHQEPFFVAAKDGPKDFLGSFSHSLRWHRDNDQSQSIQHNFPITHEEVIFLRRFPVYDFKAHEVSESVFVPFVDWFLQSVHTDILMDDTLSDSSSEDDIKELMLRDVGRLLFAFAKICEHSKFFLNADGKFGYTRLLRPWWSKSAGGPFPRYESPDKTRTTQVALFGVFRCEQIIMPAVTTDILRCPLIADQIPFGNEAPEIPDLLLVAQTLFQKADPLNTVRNTAPPHPLQLFSCILKRGFNLDFADGAFDYVAGSGWSAYDQFLLDEGQGEKDQDIFNNYDCEEFSSLLDWRNCSFKLDFRWRNVSM